MTGIVELNSSTSPALFEGEGFFDASRNGIVERISGLVEDATKVATVKVNL